MNPLLNLFIIEFSFKTWVKYSTRYNKYKDEFLEDNLKDHGKIPSLTT